MINNGQLSTRATPSTNAGLQAATADKLTQASLMKTSRLAHLDHGWVAPEAELVLAVAVAGQDLALVAGPLQRTHLAAGVNGVQLRASGGVPEPARRASKRG
jgi:hypothetical protein